VDVDGLWIALWILLLGSAFPQPRVSRAAVQFVPVPYHRPPAPVPPARPQ